MARIRKLIQKPGFDSLLASVAAIGIGLVFGLILLIIFNPSKSLYGFGQILFAGLSSTSKFSKVLYQAAPLIMTGLAVGFVLRLACSTSVPLASTCWALS